VSNFGIEGEAHEIWGGKDVKATLRDLVSLKVAFTDLGITPPGGSTGFRHCPPALDV
jgi:hypothetical protein